MACHVIRLLSETECGACAGDLPAGYAVITNQIKPPVFVAVCDGCTNGLDNAGQALRLLQSRKSTARLG